MRRLVVLGTGTGVGKTHVGAEILRGWDERGNPAWGLKPIESGVTQLEESDAGRLRAASSVGPALLREAPLHHRALLEPVSPHLAARRAGVEILLEESVRWVAEQEAKQLALRDNASHAMSLIETAGGALTPLAPGVRCAHLALALAPTSVLLVAPDALGVLHDVTATLLSLREMGCRVDLLVLSGSRPPDASTGENALELEGVVLPGLGDAAPRVRRVFQLPFGSRDVGELLDAWAGLG